MLTLKDINDYYEKGLVELRIDFTPDPGQKMHGFILSDDQITEMIRTKKISVIKKPNKEPIIFDIDRQGRLSISIEKRDPKRKEWEKIKKQMREAGFSYRSESPWFCVWEKGKWNW